MQNFGMFGPDPYQLQQQRAANDMAEVEAIDRGGMSVGVGLLARKGFNQMGDALGVADPAAERGNKMKAIVEKLRAMGIDMTDPDAFYPAMVKELSAAGLNNEAAAMAEKYQKDTLEVGLKTSQMNKYNAEATKANTEKNPEIVRLQRARQAALDRGDGPLAAEIAAEIAKRGYVEGKQDPEFVRLQAAYEKAMQEGRTEDAKQLKALLDKKGAESDGRSKTVEADGRQYVLNPAAWEANPEKRHPFLKDYVDAGKASDRSTNVKVNPTSVLNLEAGARGAEAQKTIMARLKPIGERIAAINELQMAIDNGAHNAKSAAAALNGFAKMFKGDTNMTKAEMERLISAGSLPARVGQMVWGFLAGTLTTTSTRDLSEVAQGLGLLLENRYQTTLTHSRQMLRNMKDKEGKQYLDDDAIKFYTEGPEFDAGQYSGKRKKGAMTPEERKEVEAAARGQ